MHQGHHDFGAGRAVAGDVIGKGRHVGHQLRLARQGRRAAHAAPAGDAHAGRRALEGADHQAVAFGKVKTAPADVGQGVEHQGRKVGGVGDQVVLAVQQALRLAGQLAVQRGLVGGGDGGGFKHGVTRAMQGIIRRWARRLPAER